MANKVLSLVNIKNPDFDPIYDEQYPNELYIDELDKMLDCNNRYGALFNKVKVDFLNFDNNDKEVECMKIVPYINLCHLDPIKGKIKFIMFNNENNNSISIKSDIDLKYKKELSNNFEVTNNEIFELAFKVAIDKLISIFGEKEIKILNLKPDTKKYMIFVSENNNKKFIGINIPIKVTKDNFTILRIEAENSNKFNNVKIIDIDLASIVRSFNIDATLEHIINGFKKCDNLDEDSCKIIHGICMNFLQNFRYTVPYDIIYNAIAKQFVLDSYSK